MKKIYFFFFVIFFSTEIYSQTTIAKWTFEAVATTNTGTTPTFGMTSNGADVGAQTAGSAFTGLHASAATTWSNPAGNGSTKSVSSNTWTVGDYYQFLVNTTGYTGISITFDQTGSNTGPRDFKIQYSTDGTSFTDFTFYSIPTNLNAAFSWAAGTPITQTTLSFNLSSIAALNNSPTVYFRIVDASTIAINGTTVATGGTDRVDNFAVTLTPAITAANNGSQPTSGNIAPGSTNNILQTFTLTEGGVASDSLKQVKVQMNGTYVQADISNFKLYANSTNNFGTATVLKQITSSAATASGDTVFFNALVYNLVQSTTSYFWITVDVAAGAGARNINAAALAPGNFTFAIGPPTGAVSAGGTQTFAFALPITLQNFSANKNGINTELHWLVNCLSTSVTFELQRSSDAVNFQTFYTSTETKARCSSPFDYTDANALSGKNFYRLKIIDVDGKYSYSKIVLIATSVSDKNLITVRPTIVNTQADVYYTSPDAEKVQWIITDMQGRITKQISSSVVAGENKISISTSELSSGQYQIKGFTSEGYTAVVRFVKQ